MNKILFSLLLISLITATAVAAEIKPVGGFATSNVCSSMSSSSPNILINDDFSSSLLFQGVNGVLSNGALWQFGVPGPVTGSTLTQSAVIGNVSGVNGTGSLSLFSSPFTDFLATGHTGYDFIFDPVLWMGSIGNWINYPLPGWNTTERGVVNGQGYWLTYDPLNKLAPIFDSPYGGYIEAFILPNANQDYQRYVGGAGVAFLQEIANQDYFQLKTNYGTLQMGSDAYGGFTMTADNSNFGIYHNSAGTWISGTILTIMGTTLDITSWGNISLDQPVTSNKAGVNITFSSGAYIGTDNGLHMGSNITTSSVGIYSNSTGALNPGFAEDYGPVTLTKGCTTITLQYPFPTNHYNCTFNYTTWNTAIGFPTFTFTTNQFTVCSRSSSGVINTTDANTITGTCTGY
jgi:hypothetical protein